MDPRFDTMSAAEYGRWMPANRGLASHCSTSRTARSNRSPSCSGVRGVSGSGSGGGTSDVGAAAASGADAASFCADTLVTLNARTVGAMRAWLPRAARAAPPISRFTLMPAHSAKMSDLDKPCAAASPGRPRDKFGPSRLHSDVWTRASAAVSLLPCAQTRRREFFLQTQSCRRRAKASPTTLRRPSVPARSRLAPLGA